MGTWEDELDLDLSDIWAAGGKSVQGGHKPEEDKDDDLAFPSQAPGAPNQAQSETRVLGLETRVLGLEAEHGVTRLQSENAVTPLLNPDVADAPTQVASLTAEPFISRGGSTVPLATTQNLHRDDPLPPLPTFQPIVPREVSITAPLPTQNLASRDNNDSRQRLQVPGLRNLNLREKAPVDIRKYFTHRGSSSGAGEEASRKKPRIPGPVGDLFRREQPDEADVVDGDGNAFGSGEDDFNDRIFRKGAWISALQSLNVDEFDPARYAILKVTASSIGSSRTQQVPHFVAVIKELTPNVFGDAAVILRDPTGTVAGMMNNKVFSNTDYARAISPGAVIVLKQVAIFSPSAHYLNITISNVVQVFPANTDLPQGSARKQRQQEPLPQQAQPPQPRSQPPSQQQPQQQPQPQPRSQPQPQLQPQPSPPQQEQPPEPRSQAQAPSPPPSSPQEGPKAPDAKMANWDLMSPSPSPPQEAKASEGIAAAAQRAGWGDLADDMEALLNEDVDDFYA